MIMKVFRREVSRKRRPVAGARHVNREVDQVSRRRDHDHGRLAPDFGPKAGIPDQLHGEEARTRGNSL